MKRYLFLLSFLSAALWSNAASAGSMTDYTAYPNFMSSKIKPNLVLLLDNSGSMKVCAYKDNDVWGWAGGNLVLHDNYNSSSSYYGYFESGSRYSYHTDGYFYEDASGDWDGNFLNWATMRRVDIARRVLVGGKVGINERNGPGPYYYLRGQNEPYDNCFSKYIATDELTPAKANSILTIENGKAHLSRFSVDGELEVGRIMVTSEWQTVSFANTFSGVPMLVAKPAFHYCSASEVRIDNLDANGFDIKMERFDGGDCVAVVTFMAVTIGTHTIGDIKMEAGWVVADIPAGTNSGGIKSPAFTSGFFSSTPVVMSNVCTSLSSGDDIAVARNQNVTTSGFQVLMQEGEGKTDGHNAELICWVALSKGSGAVGDQTFEVATTSGVTHEFRSISYTSAFESGPFFLADMQTYNESDAANLLLQTATSGKARLKVLEEQTGDTETGHLGEEVGYIAISMPSYNIKVQVDQVPTGVVHDIKDKVRLGLAVYNYDHNRTGAAIYTGSTANGGTLCPTWAWEEDGVVRETPTHVKAPTENIIRAIEEFPQIWGTTPTAETLYEIKRYFQQVAPYFPDHPGMSGADLGKIYEYGPANEVEWDPYYYDEFDANNKKPSCVKSFVIIISDGEPWRDFTYGNRWMAEDPEIISVVNGLGVPPGVSGSENDFVDDVAFNIHTSDLRDDIGDRQSVSVYTVLAAFGDAETGAGTSAEASMKDAAVNGGFKDKDGDDLPDPTHPDWSTWSGTSEEWDEDEDEDRKPDNYYLANDGKELKVKLVKTITDILKQTASSTAASVLSTTGEAKGVVFQAYFKPFDEDTGSSWLGYLKSLWVDPWGNLREDSNANQALDLDDPGDGDHIIQFVHEDDNSVTVYKYRDGIDDGYNDGPDGIRDNCPDLGCYPGKEGCDDCSAYKASSLDDLMPIWEAGEILAKRTEARDIFTWVDLNGDGEMTSNEVIDFHESNASILRPFLGINDPGNTLAENIIEAEKVIRFIRGEYVEGYRGRDMEVDGQTLVWKLGDIVNSTPMVVGRPAERMDMHYADASYGEFFMTWKNRNITIYAGANDGMLHAFNGGTFNDDVFNGGGGCAPAPGDKLGAERWAYIPYNLLPHLRWLTQTDYTHVNYIDLKPKITDARIFSDDATHPNGWGTILVGGMGFGGGEIELTDDFDGDGSDETRTFYSAYFCMDITDPEDPKMLWEKTHENLGFTTSYPGFVRVAGDDNPSTVGNWHVVFGSGPTDYDGTSDQNARLFVLDLESGNILRGAIGPDSFISEKPDGFMSSPVTIDYPNSQGKCNYSDDMIYIGETYGAVGGAQGSGRMLRFSTRGGNEDRDSVPAITTSAIASWDEKKNIWVYFGTGRYYNEVDKGDDSTQYFLGVIDDYLDYGVSDPVITDSNNGDGAETNLDSMTNMSGIEILTDRTLKDLPGVSFEWLVSWLKGKKGWHIELGLGNNDGERLINRPSIYGGTLFFTSFKPENDICSYGGDSYLYSLYYETGTAYKNPSIGIEDGKHVKRVYLGKGKAADVGIHVSNRGRNNKVRLIIQQSSGVISQMDAQTAYGVKPGIFAWQQR